MNPQIPFEGIIPTELKTPEFCIAWAEWVDERRITGRKITVRAAKLQLARCLDWGPAKAVESINQSIEFGWQGLFEPKEKQAVNGHKLSPMELSAIIRAKEIQAAEIKNKFSSEVAFGRVWNDPNKKVEFFHMRKEIKDLNAKLGAYRT